MHLHRWATRLAFILVAALSGCSGQTGLPGTPGPPAAVRQSGAAVRFDVKVPRKPKHRGGRYVSPATQSLSISISPTGDSKPVVTADANVTGSVAATTVRLNPGTYLAAVTTYDAQNEGGNVLSSGQSLPISIVLGKTNDVMLTLGGVPKYLSVTGSAGLTGTQAAGFVTYGTSQGVLTVVARDADGYAIVGPGAPLYSASVLTGSGWSVTPDSSPQTPGQLELSPSGVASSATVKISVSDPSTCALAGTACSLTFTVKDVLQKLYVALCEAGCGVTGVPDEIAIFAAPYTGAPTAKITSGLLHPTDVAVDANGNVFVTNCGLCSGQPGAKDTVTEYSTSNAYASPIHTIVTGLSFPYRVVVDASDDVFTRNCSGCPTSQADYVALHTASNYAGTPLQLLGVWAVEDMLVTSSGTLVVSSCNASCGGSGPDGVLEYAAPYTAAPASIAQTGPLSITLDTLGNLWAGDCSLCTNYSTVAEYLADPSNPGFFESSIANAATQSSGVYAPVAIALDDSQNLFITNGSAGSTQTQGLYEFSPPSYTVPTSLFAQQLEPRQLVVDGQGTLLMDLGGGGIAVSRPPYSSYDLTVGDGGPYGGTGSPLRFALGP